MDTKVELEDKCLDGYLVERQWQTLIDHLQELTNLLTMTSSLYKKVKQLINFVKASYRKYVDNNNRLKQLSPHLDAEPIVTSTLKAIQGLETNNHHFVFTQTEL